MQVLFIRHGETAANRRRVYQRAAEPLTARGRTHMQETAQILQSWAPTHVLASPMQRALESAYLIAETLQLPVTRFPEVREIRWPIALEGKRHRSLQSMWHMGQWFLERHVHKDDPKHGESYATLRKRIERATRLLEAYPADARIVVVSHSVYINFFVEHVCNHEHISLAVAGPRLAKVLTLQNSNATLLECTPAAADGVCNWHLEAFNTPVEALT